MDCSTFFSPSSGPRPALHSFPTRRSSDLKLFLMENVPGMQSVKREETTFLDEAARRLEERSEEHTSELQSHHELVCRLLLEKKTKESTSRRRTYWSTRAAMRCT